MANSMRGKDVDYEESFAKKFEMNLSGVIS